MNLLQLISSDFGHCFFYFEQIKPGTDNQKPCHYVEVRARGGRVTNGHTATIGKGDRLPPTSAKGNSWKKV